MANRSRLPQHIKGRTSPVDIDKSIDERTYVVMQEIIAEALQLEDPDTRSLWLDAVQTFAKTGDLGSLAEACEWRRKVVPIDEFMFSSAFMGMDEAEIYPAVLEACADLDQDIYTEAVLKGAIGTGKSTIANVMLGRALYKLSCMRHPQTTFGIQSKSSIVFTIQSVRLNTAKKAVFEEFGNYLRKSPYFMNIYSYDKNLLSEMVFREQNVRVMPVSSSSTGAISMNVIGGILDEMNFMQKIQKSKSANAELDGSFDQAKALYNTLSRRRKSRFTRRGKLPGTLFLVSSSRFPDDFTELKSKESTEYGGTDKTIFVYSHSQWSAKGREHFLPDDFRVQVGTERVRTRILQGDEQPVPGCDVIDVPVDFKTEFEKDPDGSLRDFAGITSLASKPFIKRRDVIHTAMSAGESAGYQNIINVEQLDLSLGIPKANGNLIRLDVPSDRVAHVDLGINKDACGLAVGHLAGHKVVERRNEDTGLTELEIRPVIAYDLILRIVPPPGGEIEFANVRQLLMRLRDNYKIPLRYVTFDGFQSVDSRQILKKNGFITDYLSVEKIEPWNAFRDALYEETVLLPAHHWAAKELAELEEVVKNNKSKIDHRPNGTKDVADAIVGVAAFILSRRSSWAGGVIDRRVGTYLLGSGGTKTETELAARRQTLRRAISNRPVIKRLAVVNRKRMGGNRA